MRVNFLRFLSFCVVFLIPCTPLLAQDEGPRRGSRVIDDTTRQIYGPTTSRFFYEHDVFFNSDVLHPIDTVIRNFHRFGYVERFDYLYQDLGFFGSSIRPIYYQLPRTIGVRPGFDSYDLYWNTEAIRYYDTKSPYSNINIILAGRGRSITRATYSRNINPRWNFGFNYRGFFIDKQVFRQGKGDRATISNYYDVFTTYQSRDSSYRLFFSFQRMFHKVSESGGVRFEEGEDFEFADYFDINARIWLTEAESNDLRRNLHLFHQYRLGSGLQIYHIADAYRQTNRFLDLPDQEPEGFYDFVETDRDTTRDVTKFRTYRNELGVKGNLLKLFYNGYIALRNYSMFYNFASPGTLPQSDTERYIGGRMRLQLDSLFMLDGHLEVMTEGNYQVKAGIYSRWLEASLQQMLYKPTFIEQAYRASHDFWNNNFDNTDATQLKGYLHYRSKDIALSPGLTLTRLRNYVYFDQVTDQPGQQQVLPVQSTGYQLIASPELRLSLTVLRHIQFSFQGIYTRMLENANDAIRVPELLINTQLAYENIFFNGNLDMHAGIDVHWRSAYPALSYDVAIRQFYNQHITEVGAFPLVNLFFNAKIKRGRIFVQWHNPVQAITREGYLPTPGYPGQRNAIDFGFDWSFYD